ncbi:MAG TPA: protein kinase [Trebonia sp.]|nr:protein kinase [Trebonia sp.]
MNAWTVPGYIEERQLGRGASGRVVAAVHERSGHPVAIKYLAPQLFRDPAFLDGFREEAELLRSLDVPDVVRIYDYVEMTDQGAAIVMERVDGVSLHEMISRQGPASPESALTVLKGSLLGLAAAHQMGIVHRDYKPENVLVDAEGNSKLSDFGVAVRAGHSVPVAGTPLYMAPEQWAGAPATPATDIYAASAVFFECLTGRAPFSGRLDKLAAQHESAPVPLQQVEEPMGDLIAWGMEKDPRRRPVDALEFVAELDHLASEAFGAYWEDRGRSQLRERALALLALLGGIAIAGGEGSAQAASFFGRAGRRNMALGAAAVVILGLAAGGTVYALTGNNSTSAGSSASGDGSGGGAPDGTGSASSTGAGSSTPTTSASPSTKPSASATPSATPSATLPGTTPTTAAATPTATTAATAAPKLSVALSSSPGSPDAVACGGSAPTFTLTGTVSSTQATTISYTWKRSNGTSSSGTAHVGAGSSVTLHDSLAAASTSWKGSDALDVTSPAAASSSLPLSVTCTYPAVAVSVSTPPDGLVGATYEAAAPSASGGDGGPYTWSATGLPPGLTISSSTGTISGTPSTQGNYSVTISAKDAHGDTGSKTESISISVIQ